MTAPPRAALPATVRLDPGRLRAPGAAVLAAAAVLPLLPGTPGAACPLRALTGVPCPLCGMTTGVVDAVHLRMGDALAANPAAVALVVAVVLVLVVPRPGPWVVPRWAVAAVAVAAVVAAEAFQLARFGYL